MKVNSTDKQNMKIIYKEEIKIQNGFSWKKYYQMIKYSAIMKLNKVMLLFQLIKLSEDELI